MEELEEEEIEDVRFGKCDILDGVAHEGAGGALRRIGCRSASDGSDKRKGELGISK